jgi:hypothetical protein
VNNLLLAQTILVFSKPQGGELKITVVAKMALQVGVIESL